MRRIDGLFLKYPFYGSRQMVRQLRREGTESSISKVTIMGEPVNRSRRTYDHSSSSPIGKLAQTLFKVLGDLKLGQSAGIPNELVFRLERLFDAPGEGSDYAICETTRRLRWLYSLDPDWVRNRIVPMFKLDHPDAEPAWNGYLHDTRLPAPDLFGLLKPFFLNVITHISQWHWDEGPAHRLHEFLVIACYWNRKGEKYITYEEARAVLQQSDNEGRAHTLWFLATIVKDERAWRRLGKPFIKLAWPRESRFQTEATSRQFAAIAEESGSNFPDVVKTILPLLVLVERLDFLLYRMAKERDGEVEREIKYPEPLLALTDRLVPNEPPIVPYGLPSLLNQIAEAAPRLRQDPRWRRLNRIASSQ
jgi:hypothetical protein